MAKIEKAEKEAYAAPLRAPSFERLPLDGQKEASDASALYLQGHEKREFEKVEMPEIKRAKAAPEAAPAAVANSFQEGAPLQGTIDRMEGDIPVVEVNGQLFNLVPVE